MKSKRVGWIDGRETRPKKIERLARPGTSGGWTGLKDEGRNKTRDLSLFLVWWVGGCGFEKPSKAKPGKVGSEGRQ